MSKHVHEQFMEGFKKAAKRSGFSVNEPCYELGQNIVIEKTAEALEKNANPEFINNLLGSLQSYGQQLGNFAQPYVDQGLDFVTPYLDKGRDFAKANPTLMGAGIGALAGGGINLDSDRNHILRNAILGSLAGGMLGYDYGDFTKPKHYPPAIERFKPQPEYQVSRITALG